MANQAAHPLNNPIAEALWALEDKDYKAFNSKLIPTVDEDRVIGIRIPTLRRLAKSLVKQPESQEFLASLPHYYFEENNLHGFMLESIIDYDELIEQLSIFLPYVDNWATCDTCSPKLFKKHPAKLPEQALAWMQDSHPYTIRFGINVLRAHYLDDCFDPRYLDAVAAIQSEEYYVNMMRAWYFADALVKQQEAALPFFMPDEKGNYQLDGWTHNKALQKAVESLRFTPEQKAVFRSLKRSK